MKTLSDASQIAALDSAIAAMERGHLPDRRERILLAEHLKVVRQRVQAAKDKADERAGR